MSQSKMDYDVITVGSATLDIFVKSNQFKVVEDSEFSTGMALCEAYGAKIEIDEVHMVSGGGGTNNAVSFARKGLKAGCIAEMGTDLAAQSILHEMKSEKVDTSMIIQEADENTGISVIMIALEGGRSIVTCRGAAAMLDLKDVPWDNLSTEWLYISSLGGRLDVLSKLIQHATENNIKIALNPGKKELAEVKHMRDMCCKVDVLMMNLEEAMSYLELTLETEEQEVLMRMKESGGKISIVTNGNKGAYILTEKKDFFSSPTNDQVIETTGAGDAYGSGFVAGQVLGMSLEESITLASANAESVIKYFGAKKGLLSSKDLDNLNISGVSEI